MFVDTYADMIIDFIAQGITPEQVHEIQGSML
jgi:hypothetical protein